MRYEIVNLGCKVNRVESDSYGALLASIGTPATGVEAADIVVVNTCTVTGEAEKKTRKAVRSACRRHPRARIIVTGCAAAIDPDGFLGMGPAVQVVPKARMEGFLAEMAHAGPVGAWPSDAPKERVRRGVKVQDGCDHACTYCIVHVARGPARSIPAEEVIGECRRLIGACVPEIVLTGINLGSYADGARRLPELLRSLLAEAADAPECRFRLSSIEPRDVSGDLIELMAASDGRICRHLHLPLQSGSSRVLAQMARPYDADGYLSLVSALRSAMPAISLTTDIIAGFPGETDEDHAQSTALARACGFSKMHVFPYSKRTGTPAAARNDQVAPETRLQRASELRALSDELRRADLAGRAGTVERAVVEVPGRACTESYHEVAVPESAPVGSMVAHRFGVQ